MARLPKSIIKEYGISKKAWAVFRGNKRGNRKMAKRRSHKKGHTQGMGKFGKMLLGFTVDTVVPLTMGLVRAKVGDGIQSAAQKVGINSAYADEVALISAEGLVGLYPNYWVKRASANLQSIEKERIGEMMRLKVPVLGSGGSMSATGSTSSGIVFY